MSYTLAQLRTMVADTYLDKSDAKALRVADRIINSAMRLGATAYDWEWFQKTGRVNTVAQQSSGTVAISNGGTQVVLTGGTWPTTVVGRHIRINDSDADFEIGTRDSATSATFVSGHQWNDTAVTTGTYVLYKDRVSLPGDCRKFGGINVEDTEWDPVYGDFQGWLRYKRVNPLQSGDPDYVAHDNSYLYFWPPPDSAEAIDCAYDRWPASASTAADTIDWPDQRIDVLYGLIGLQLEVHRGKMTYDEAMSRAKNMAWRMAGDDPKYKGPESISPMSMGEVYHRPRHWQVT